MNALLLLIGLFGCAGIRYPGPVTSIGALPPPPEYREPEPEAEVARERRAEEPGAPVADAAEHYLGKGRLTHGGELYRWDCSGFIEATYARAGLSLSGSSVSMYENAQAQDLLSKRKTPDPGDVVFFENTYDRNGNGRIDDDITHVAIVTSVDDDGTVHMVHKGGSGVTRLVLNLNRPGDHQDESGKVINSYLRNQTRRDPRGTRYLTGELWRGFASYWDAPSTASL